MKDDRLYLIHIHECLRRIATYLRGGRKSFLTSTLVQDAVLRNLQTLTESTQRLSADLKSSHPTIDWRGMSAFRNLLVHRYLGINIERVWGIIENDLPVLKNTVKALFKELKMAIPRKPRKSVKPRKKPIRKKKG